MISLALRAGVLSMLCWLVGCGPPAGDPEQVGQQVFECPTASASVQLPADRPGAPPEPAAAAAVLAFDEGGALGVLDPRTGAELALESTEAGAIGALERDLAYDAAAGRAVVFESDDEGQSGGIRVVPLGAGGLGPSQHRAWVDGRARVLAVPAAVAVFELGYGQRWKLLRDDGQPTASLVAPPPAAAWLAAARPPAIEALVRQDDAAEPAWVLARAGVVAGQLGAMERHALELSGGPLGAVRASRWPESDELLVAWLADGVLRLGRFDRQGAALESWMAGAQGGRLVAVAPLAPRPGGGLLAAALLAEPSRLLVADLGGGAARWSAWQLDAPVPFEGNMISRLLAIVSARRLLVATHAAVAAIDVVLVPDGPRLELDPRFDGRRWRGPLAVIAGRAVRTPSR